MVNPGRINNINTKLAKQGPVICWMSRDQRVNDNWALIFASELAVSINQPLVVIFCLVPDYLNAIELHYSFMLSGLKKVKEDLMLHSIPFYLLKGIPGDVVPNFSAKISAGAIVTDFNPLKINRKWKEDVAEKIDIPFFEVDTHNIVPCRIVSQKQEYGARTIRPKILRLLPEYLTDFPQLPVNEKMSDLPDPEDYPIMEIKNHGYSFQPGELAAKDKLNEFLSGGIDLYHKKKNHPELNGLSGLSPYLHFGQISSQRIVLEIMKTDYNPEGKSSFLEEIIIRKELSDNYCFYNKNYDNFNGFPTWGRKTLDEHRHNQRDFIYTTEEFENSLTHDKLWNAAQKEMVLTGKMHGYIRMYWAKKILEWSDSPESAQSVAIYLNDKYSLDGRDPNGYAGISWSIGGTHDRPWFNRPVFGNIRYMSFNGMKSKFNIKEYIMQNT